MTQNPAILHNLACTLLPGGVNSPVRAFRSVDSTPIYIQSAKGAYLISENHTPYIDYICAWGAMILGHQDPELTETIQRALTKGSCFGAATALELEFAQHIIKLIPSIEMLRAMNSGTEATMTAIRLARGFTRRDKIIQFKGHYHGHSDSVLQNTDGIPQAISEQTLIATFNDLASVEALFKQYPNEIAGIIVEPIAGNMNLICPHPEFLVGLRTLCDRYNSVLIFDEVMTGFRVALGGAQSLYGVIPDLTCLGKIIGGGFPVGALGGKKIILQHLAPFGSVYHGGTFSGNPITMAAGLHVLKRLEAPQFYEKLENKTTYLINGLKEQASFQKVPFQAHSVGSMFGLYFANTVSEKNQNQHNVKFKQFFHAMLAEQIYLAPCAFEAGFLSLAHDQTILDRTIAASAKAFSKLH